MQTRNYPIGRQDFPGIRREGSVYVDKTLHVFNLITTSKYNFLSKPRRFGKSLLISTLETVFKGQKEFFEGLYIYDKWLFETYPVIRISFSNIGYREIGLETALKSELQKIAKSYEITLAEDKVSQSLRELIIHLHIKFKKQVVLLIDEYDKPIIDYLDKENLNIAQQNRVVMKSFYSVLKDADPHLKFVLITGVSKFSKVSIFSDLNNLNDISISFQFNAICGISQKELEINFSEELKLVDKEKVKKWYNGYRWDIEGDTVYNPFSILNFFYNGGRFHNFWYTTGTPTFLMKMCRELHFYKFDDITINADELGNFDIENLKIEPILFQTGYLTILEYNPLFRTYKLGFPNQEVRESYLRNLTEAYIDSSSLKSSKILGDLTNALKNRDENLLKEAINNAFEQVPYGLWQKENEQYYHALVHLLFSLLGVYIFSEVQTKRGRTDSLVIFEGQVYCLEFKLDKSAQEAIDQINEMGYTSRFKGQTIHQIGINFSSAQREVAEIIWQTTI